MHTHTYIHTHVHTHTHTLETTSSDLEATYCEVDLSNFADTERKLSLNPSPQTYEVPMHSLSAMLQQSSQEAPSSANSEHYDIPVDAKKGLKPLMKRGPLNDDDDYTEIASVPLWEGFLANRIIENSENIYESI